MSAERMRRRAEFAEAASFAGAALDAQIGVLGAVALYRVPERTMMDMLHARLVRLWRPRAERITS